MKRSLSGTYINTGHLVLSVIVETVSGQSFSDYVFEHIFRPLRMEHTDYIYSEEMLRMLPLVRSQMPPAWIGRKDLRRKP